MRGDLNMATAGGVCEVEALQAECEKRFLKLISTSVCGGSFELVDSRGVRVFPQHPGGAYPPSIRGFFLSNPQS